MTYAAQLIHEGERKAGNEACLEGQAGPIEKLLRADSAPPTSDARLHATPATRTLP